MSANGKRGRSCGGRQAGAAWIGDAVRLFGLVLVGILAVPPGDAVGQATNQILQVEPASASQGTADLLVTFTLDTDFPPPPPPGDGPQSVTIGTIQGASITHATSSTVTARFDIPADESPGPKDVSISFQIPGGTLVFTSPGGFTVSSGDEGYNIERTLSDQAQSTTIAFDGLGFLTGNLGSQSFLPPGKVADLSGFQYLRDNDPTDMGHSTSFVTIVAFNVLHVLTSDQIGQLVARARNQVGLINGYAYERFPLMKAFRRLLDGDVPAGSQGLDLDAVKAYSASLYRIDGRISYDRAKLIGGIVRSMSPAQIAALDSLKALNGVGHWDSTLADPLGNLHLDHDVNVAVMTYASEMYSWYAGSVEADTYFCPERQGTYFGSFYLKDWPAMGNPGYHIDEQLTARAGDEFLAALSDSQRAAITGLVDLQRNDLNGIVARREDISTQLRRFLSGESPDSAAVLGLAGQYGELDGEIVYNYATRFSQVGRSLDAGQRDALASLADSLGYVPPAGAFLYSDPIDMPPIENTNFLFGVPAGVGGSGSGGTRPGDGLDLTAAPNPAAGSFAIRFVLPAAATGRLAIYDASGRVVRVVARGQLAAGAHEVSWEGSDGVGRRLPSGTYFARLEGGISTRTVKLTLTQ